MTFFQQVWFHKLGTPPTADTYGVGKDFERIAENFLLGSDDGKWQLDLKQKGDGGEFELWLLAPGGGWTRIAKYEDQVVSAQFGFDGVLYLLSTKGAPRGRLLRLPLSMLSLEKATVIVPEGKDVLAGFRPTPGRIDLRQRLGPTSHIRVVSLKGETQLTLPSPPVTTVGGLVRLSGDEVLIHVTGYLQPSGWFRGDLATAGLAPTMLRQNSPIDLSGFEALEETVAPRSASTASSPSRSHRVRARLASGSRWARRPADVVRHVLTAGAWPIAPGLALGAIGGIVRRASVLRTSAWRAIGRRRHVAAVTGDRDRSQELPPVPDPFAPRAAHRSGRSTQNRITG